MGYSDLIDRLVDTRIHEGMLSTIRGKGVTPLLDALESGDIKQIKGSNIKIDTHYFNNSPFSRDLLLTLRNMRNYLVLKVRIIIYTIYPIRIMII